MPRSGGALLERTVAQQTAAVAYTKSIADTASATDAQAKQAGRRQDDTATWADAHSKTARCLRADTGSFTEAVQRSPRLAVGDTAQATDAASQQATFGRAIADTATATDARSKASAFARPVAETATVGDASAHAIAVSRAELATLLDGLVPVQGAGARALTHSVQDAVAVGDGETKLMCLAPLGVGRQ